METTEHLLALARELEAELSQANETINRILDLPIRSGTGSVYGELIASGYTPGGDGDYGHGTAWNACRRIIEQRQALVRLRSEITSEAEILTGIADDVIGKTGRLI